jgi:tRNA(Ile)-lysidine synthase
MIEEILRKTIQKYGLIEKKDRIILGTSGGPDSIFMFYQFIELRKKYNLQLVCAHFNHALRSEADTEEEFVKNLCKNLDMKCMSERKEVNKFFNGDSLEQTARNLRFDFFLKCSRHFKIKKLALAHHKDDLVETVLMRLVRGAGLKGLRGFLPKSKFVNLTVIRPLIELSKQEIISWLNGHKISYCMDKSNLEEKFLRNRIRLKLLPFLKELNPDIANNIYDLSRNLSLDYDFIYKFSHLTFEDLKKGETAKTIKLDLEGLKKLHPAVLSNVIMIAIEELKGSTRRIESKHIHEIIELILYRPAESVVNLPFLAAKKEAKTLIIQSLIL